MGLDVSVTLYDGESAEESEETVTFSTFVTEDGDKFIMLDSENGEESVVVSFHLNEFLEAVKHFENYIY
jgi:hypothetical protein